MFAVNPDEYQKIFSKTQKQWWQTDSFQCHTVSTAHCFDGPLFCPHVVRCANITDIQLLTASSISFQDKYELRKMAALLGCLNGFMTSIYLYRLTQTLTLTLNLTNLCLILTLTLPKFIPLNLVPHRCSAGSLVHLTTCRRNSEPAEQ